MANFALFLLLFATSCTVTFGTYAVTTCPHLYNPLYGQVSASGYSYGSTARYYCQSGYSMYSNQYGLYPLGSYYLRTCMDGGIWSGGLPRCGKCCNFLLYSFSSFQ